MNILNSNELKYNENDLFFSITFICILFLGLGGVYLYNLYKNKKNKLIPSKSKAKKIIDMFKMLNDYNDIMKRYEERTVTAQDAERMKEIANTFKELKLKLKKNI